ncbi:MAG TPA: MerR family transcriptional regulator [Streptosporangiaceae bacterium]
MASYLISELAERAGVPPTTLRYYEQAGLLPAARSANGYRRYGDDAVARLALIRAGQQLGLPLAQLRDLLTVRDTGACADVRARLRPLLAARIAQARDRAAAAAGSITRLEQALAATVPAPGPGPCDSACGCLTGPAPRLGGDLPLDNSKKNPGAPQPLPPQKLPSSQRQPAAPQPLPPHEPPSSQRQRDALQSLLPHESVSPQERPSPHKPPLPQRQTVPLP